MTNRHGLPESFWNQYETIDETFKNKFYPDVLKGISGGRIWNMRICDDFVSIAAENAQKFNYDGQVICLMLGSNDWARHVSELEFEERYQTLVEKFLAIPNTAVVVTGLLPRESEEGSNRRTDMSVPNKIIRKIATYLSKNNNKVWFVALHKIVLEKGTGDSRDSRVVATGSLKDGVHLSQSAVDTVAAKLMEAIRKLPKSWFPLHPCNY